MQPVLLSADLQGAINSSCQHMYWSDNEKTMCHWISEIFGIYKESFVCYGNCYSATLEHQNLLLLPSETVASLCE